MSEKDPILPKPLINSDTYFSTAFIMSGQEEELYPLHRCRPGDLHVRGAEAGGRGWCHDLQGDWKAATDGSVTQGRRRLRQRGDRITRADRDRRHSREAPGGGVLKGNLNAIFETFTNYIYFVQAFPDHCFIGEEDISATPSGMVETFTNKPTWIIDPIDGTLNFIHKNPMVVTSIGLTINK